MIDRLKQSLTELQKKCVLDNERIPSAVLLPIFYTADEYYLLFIKRTETVKDHKGQISFPGGRYEVEDKTLLNTALREFTEEIGMAADKIEILGDLDDCKTVTTMYVVSAFIGLIPYPFDFKPDQKEVDYIVEIPISFLAKENLAQRSNRDSWYGKDSEFVYHFKNEVIWGVTARILNQFLEIWAKSIPDK